jgi:FtsZ-binding cell division protein ZapB
MIDNLNTRIDELNLLKIELNRNILSNDSLQNENKLIQTKNDNLDKELKDMQDR